MLTKISLVVALCSGLHYGDVQKKIQAIQTQNPGTVVSVRVDKKAACFGNQVLTGRDAKLFEALGK